MSGPADSTGIRWDASPHGRKGALAAKRTRMPSRFAPEKSKGPSSCSQAQAAQPRQPSRGLTACGLARQLTVKGTGLFGLPGSDVPREAPGRPSGISARALASENRRAAKAARLARAEQMNTPQNVARASRAAARARANGRALIFLYCFLFFGETHRERAERAAGGSASEPSRATRTWRSGNPSRAAARARASSFRSSGRS